MQRNAQRTKGVNIALNNNIVIREDVVCSRAFKIDCKIWEVIGSLGSEVGLNFCHPLSYSLWETAGWHLGYCLIQKWSYARK